MLSIKIHIMYIVIMTTILEIKSLLKLSTDEDNNRNIAEITAQDTVNKLFTFLKISEANWQRTLHDAFKTHDYFNPIEATCCNNLKDVVEVSRVNDIDNSIHNNIIKINEVFQDNDKNGKANDTSTFVVRYIENVIGKLRKLKEKYETKSKYLKYTILNLNDNDATMTYDNFTVETSQESDDDTFNYTEFWKPSARRIYRGFRTRIKNYPFVVSVQFFRKFQCAGSIIKNDLVITSASCLQLAWNNRFFRENPAYLSVRVGSDYYEYGGESIDVQEIYFYPSYDPKTLKNNIAIMRLVRKLKFSNKQKRIKKIDIDRGAHPLPENTGYITVLGWGARDSSNIVYNIHENKLAYANLGFYPLDECQDHYGRDFVTKKNFCAGFFSRGAGACNRDSGGPAIIDYTLTGVISFGSPICGSPDKPTVMTKLGYYADWIDEIIAQHVPSTYKKTTTIAPYIFTIPEVITTKKIRLTPMMDTTKSASISVYDALRLLQEEGSKDFFTSEEIEQIYEVYNTDPQKYKHERLGTNKDIAQNIQLKETKTGTVGTVIFNLNKLASQDINMQAQQKFNDSNSDSIENIVQTVKNLTALAENKITQQPYNEDGESDESKQTDTDLVNDPPIEADTEPAHGEFNNLFTYDALIETAITAINISPKHDKHKLIPQQHNVSKSNNFIKNNTSKIFKITMKPIQRKQKKYTTDLHGSWQKPSLKQKQLDNSKKFHVDNIKTHKKSTETIKPITSNKLESDPKVKTPTIKDTIKSLIDDLDLDNILKQVGSINDNTVRYETNNAKKNTNNLFKQSTALKYLLSSDEEEIGLSIPSESFHNTSLDELPEIIEYNKIPKHILFDLVSLAVEEELKRQAKSKKVNRKGQPYLI